MEALSYFVCANTRKDKTTLVRLTQDAAHLVTKL